MDFLSFGLLAAASLTLFAGGLVKGVAGVGLPLVSVTLLAFFLPPHTAVILLAIPILLSNLIQMVQGGSVFHTIRRFWPLILPTVICTSLGVRLLGDMNGETLALALGVLTATLSAILLAVPRFHIPHRLQRPLAPVAGITAGLVGGITSFYGPVLMLYLLGLDLKRDDFVRSIATIYLAAVIPFNLSITFHGLLGWPEFLASCAAMIPVYFGMELGRHLRGHIPEDRFKKGVLALLLIIGCTIIARQLF